MEDLTLISRQEPGIAVIDNFQELKSTLETQLEVYKNIVYSADGVKAAKKDKAALNKLKKAIDDRRKEIKKAYMEPYLTVEAQAKELVALIDEPLRLITAFISQEEEMEKAARREQIKAYFYQHSAALGNLADIVFASPAFYETKWENKSTTVKAYQDAISAKIQQIAGDTASIRAVGGSHTAALMHYNPLAYIKTESDVLKFVTALIANTKGDGKEGDEFWTKAETLLYCALVAYIVFEGPEEERNMNTLVEMINSMEVREDDETFKNAVDYMFDGLERRSPQHFAVRQYKKYKLASGVVCFKRLLNQSVRKSLKTYNLQQRKERKL